MHSLLSCRTMHSRRVLPLALISVILSAFFLSGSSAFAVNVSPRVIAHRGGSKWAPENTLAAFRKCLAAGVYGLELDIQRCKTGELVVIHDEELSRTTSGAGLVKDKTLEELKKLDAGSWFSPQYKGEPIPLLQDVLKLIDGKMVINIEIKNTPIAYPGIEDELIKVLADYKHPETIIISSFDHEVLKRMSGKSSKYKLAMLGDSIILNVGDYAASVGATLWHPYYGSVRKDVVDNAHKYSLALNVWTVDKREDWKSMVELGVDGIVTDDPVGLGEFLIREVKAANR